MLRANAVPKLVVVGIGDSSCSGALLAVSGVGTGAAGWSGNLGTVNIVCCYGRYLVLLCVLCGSQNNQGLFPYTTLTDWFL